MTSFRSAAILERSRPNSNQADCMAQCRFICNPRPFRCEFSGMIGTMILHLGASKSTIPSKPHSSLFSTRDGGKGSAEIMLRKKVGQMLAETIVLGTHFNFANDGSTPEYTHSPKAFLDELIYNQEKRPRPDYVKYCLKHLKTRLRSWLPLDRREEEPLERNFAYLPFESAGFAKMVESLSCAYGRGISGGISIRSKLRGSKGKTSANPTQDSGTI